MITLIQEKWQSNFINNDKIEYTNEKDYILSCIKREIANTRFCKCENVVELYSSIKFEYEFILSFELCNTNLNDYIIMNSEYMTNLHMNRNNK